MRKAFIVARMRKVGLLLATCMMFSLTTSMTGPYATKYIVEPGHVVKVNNPELRFFITGSVTLKESPLGSDSDTANRGGGCLIYLTPGAKACTANTDCTIRLRIEGAFSRVVPGYCASTSHFVPPARPPHAEPPPMPMACWYKPKPESCVRRPDPTHNSPLQENVQLRFDHATPIHPPDVPGPISWRVVSCQNIVDKGCRNDDPNGKVYRFGAIRRFP